MSFQGPVPPPELLNQYDVVVPGAADRLLFMAEEEGRHRRGLVDRAVDANIASDKRGQYLGFVIAMTFGVMAFWLILQGRTVGGSVLGTVDLGALVALFVIGRRGEKETPQSD